VPFTSYIAFRYLFSKKSHHAINIISGVSVFGVAVATAALVCIMSVFNGFQDMVAQLFTAFDPQLEIRPATGKYMAADEPELERIRGDERIAQWCETIEDNAMVMVNNRQTMVTIKGVDDNFENVISPDILYGDGTFQLHVDVIDYGIPGINLLTQLGLDTSYPPLKVYAPRQGERINLNDPTESFNQDELYSPGVAFQVKQGKYDNDHIITSISFARRIFERQGYVTAVELQTRKGTDIDRLQRDLKQALGPKYSVLNRYEQQADTFRIMKIEKLMSYIFLTFILLVACFNIIGSLSMLIIDKRDDIHILRNLGATDSTITSIFLMEGRLIAILGAVLGILLGLALCLAQQHYGLIKFGQSAGSYITNVYPVSVHAIDILLIFVTVVLVGFASVWLPVRRLSHRMIARS